MESFCQIKRNCIKNSLSVTTSIQIQKLGIFIFDFQLHPGATQHTNFSNANRKHENKTNAVVSPTRTL